MGKFNSKANLEENILYVNLEGYFFDDEILAATQRAMNEAVKLKPNFDMIVDISQFLPVSEVGKKHIGNFQLFISEKGVRNVLRIVGHNSSASKQFAQKPSGVKFIAYFVETMEEAKSILSKQNQQSQSSNTELTEIQ